MNESVWWCPVCGSCDINEPEAKSWHLPKPSDPSLPVKWEKCPGVPIDLIARIVELEAEREHLLALIAEGD